jgi:ribosome-associated protein
MITKQKIEEDVKQSAALAKLAYDALDDKQGMDIKILDIHEISILADYFIIAHGNNPNHVRAMIDSVQDKLSEAGYDAKDIEGYADGTWVLMDFGRIIVHVFHKEARMFYDLERIWSDGRVLDPKELPAQ